jgi:hypothetical protein
MNSGITVDGIASLICVISFVATVVCLLFIAVGRRSQSRLLKRAQASETRRLAA